MKTYRQANKEKIKCAQKVWRETNRDSILKKKKKYYQNNKPQLFALVAARRAKKLKACPSWVDKAALHKVSENRPEGLHVDHIVPLQNEIVCGLHVPWNLQYLTPEENLAKSNKWPWPEDLYKDKFK